MLFLFWGTPLSAMECFGGVMLAKTSAVPRGGRPDRCLDFAFHFCYINNPGKAKFWHRRFASTERPETVPTGSCQPMVSDTRSLNYYGFAHIAVPSGGSWWRIFLGGVAISLFWLNRSEDRVCESCSNKKKGRGLPNDTAIGIELIQFCTLVQRQKVMRAEKS